MFFEKITKFKIFCYSFNFFYSQPLPKKVPYKIVQERIISSEAVTRLWAQNLVVPLYQKVLQPQRQMEWLQLVLQGSIRQELLHPKVVP